MNLLRLAKLCLWAYTLDKRYGVIYDDTGACTVAFRGTSTIDDVYHDVMAGLMGTCANGFVGSFVKSFHEIEDSLLGDTKRCTGSVTLTGHSLGGSMATIAASMYFPNATVVTFGEPRTCCGGHTVERFTRVVNRDGINHDLIPSLIAHDMNHCTGPETKLQHTTILLHPIKSYIKHLAQHGSTKARGTDFGMLHYWSNHTV